MTKSTILHLTLTENEVKNNPFITKTGAAAFYKFLVQEVLGRDYDKTTLDCRKINVSEDISESWSDYAKENNIDAVGYGMLMLNQGPKTLDTLPDMTVELLDGWWDEYKGDED